ncbi:hypothetical protein NL108_017559 [Boleophthalmus pectinirostris]|nr:hypothetical protein NL108_017559 [Boleophthalmus pectinirostris]
MLSRGLGQTHREDGGLHRLCSNDQAEQLSGQTLTAGPSHGQHPRLGSGQVSPGPVFGVCLWVGTRGGHMILVELSKNQALQVLGPHCQSVRCIVPSNSDLLNWKNVVLVLGRKLPQDKTQFEEESVLSMWNSALATEVRDLSRVCEKRDKMAARMRDQLLH